MRNFWVISVPVFNLFFFRFVFFTYLVLMFVNISCITFFLLLHRYQGQLWALWKHLNWIELTGLFPCLFSPLFNATHNVTNSICHVRVALAKVDCTIFFPWHVTRCSDGSNFLLFGADFGAAISVFEAGKMLVLGSYWRLKKQMAKCAVQVLAFKAWLKCLINLNIYYKKYFTDNHH